MKKAKSQKISGGQAAVLSLKKERTKHVFGLIGSATMEMFDALYNEKSIDFIALNESLATVGGTFPKAKVIGIAANTSMLSLEDAEIYLKKTAEKTGILVTDPVRFGIDSIGKHIASS